MKDPWITCEGCKKRYDDCATNEHGVALLGQKYKIDGVSVGLRSLKEERGNGHIMVHSRKGPIALCLTDQ